MEIRVTKIMKKLQNYVSKASIKIEHMIVCKFGVCIKVICVYYFPSRNFQFTACHSE
jgi:hypothetical protein